MRRRRVSFLVVLGVVVALGTANAALVQEDFEGLPTGAGTPAGWIQDPYTYWEVGDVGGNQALRGVSGPHGGGDGRTGPLPADGPAWYVENFEMQVSLMIESGEGGGIGIGQFNGNQYTGNAYYVEISTIDSWLAFAQEGMSAGMGVLGVSYDVPVVNGQWYDLRLVSTGTTFEVWFRVHTTAPWSETDRKIVAAQDALTPGHKSYVEGLAGCWTQDDAGVSTVLFDDFRLEAVPFPAPSDFVDHFEDSDFSLANWSQHWATLDFPVVDGSHVAHITTAGRAGGIGIGLARQYYTHNFLFRASMYIDAAFDGGIVWGWEGTATEDVDFHIEIDQGGGLTRLCLDEDAGVPGETRLASSPWQAATDGWYTIEIVADYERYYIWWWPRGTAQPSAPVIDVAQDAPHPGYRLMNLGAIGCYVNNYDTGYFDDVYFHATAAPSENTSEGSGVVVEPEQAPDLSMTFDTVTEGGTTTVEVSTTAPGGGPGGLEFEGVYYDIDTTCVYSGPITISFSYDDTGMTQEQEESLRLMHWITADQTWVDITTPPVDTVNNIITGHTNSLSVFAIASLPQFVGFLSPINMPPTVMSVFKQKSTIPVKFKLLNARTGEPVTDAIATIWGQRVANGVPGEVNEALASKVPDVGVNFRYDSQENLYVYNLSTKTLLSGCVYRIHANIMDGLMDQWVDIAVK